MEVQGQAVSEKEGRLWAALQEVIDPEMPINIVDLGLIYSVSEQAGQARVHMTLTAMGCPGSEFIIEDIRERLLQVEGVQSVAVEVGWNPPWSAKRISEAGRDALESWGLAL